MVSKAREDFPDPLTPVTTVRAARGNSTSTFLRLFWRAPWSRTNPASSRVSGAGTSRSYHPRTRRAARENPDGPEDVHNPQRAYFFLAAFFFPAFFFAGIVQSPPPSLDRFRLNRPCSRSLVHFRSTRGSRP